MFHNEWPCSLVPFRSSSTHENKRTGRQRMLARLLAMKAASVLPAVLKTEVQLTPYILKRSRDLEAHEIFQSPKSGLNSSFTKLSLMNRSKKHDF